MKNRFLLLATMLCIATATFLYWFSYQNTIDQKLEALDKDLTEIQRLP